MSFETFVAHRYLTGRRKGLRTFITTGIAIAGVTLGVAALIVTLAVMNGFHTEIQKRILGVQSHVVVGSNSGSIENYTDVCRSIESVDEVIASAPYVYSQAVLKGEGRGNSTGAVIKGIIYNREKKVANIDMFLCQGSWQNIENLQVGMRSRTPSASTPGKGTDGQELPTDKWIVLGKVLSRTLNAGVGEKVFLVSLSGSFISPIPKIETLTVSGIFDSGMYDYDANMAYTSIKTAQKIFGLPDIATGISVKIKNADKAVEIAKEIRYLLGNKYWTQSWQMMNKNLFSALKLEKIMMFIVLTLIVIVAAFNIISNLLLFTVEKVRDIGILSALGATRKNIERIFLFEGLFIGSFGIVVGTGLGIVISILVDKYKLVKLPPDIYYLDRIPLRVAPGDIAIVVLAAFIIVLISTIYPARKAASTDPLEAIRYG
ncbi:MAG: ABC transporter permease [Elusimicrobiota bacterium]|nr:ABC transporter permease [Elusimicrobiota bacterium]